MHWLARLFNFPERPAPEPSMEDFVTRYKAQERAADEAASVDKKHYTEHVEKVKVLKKEGKLDEAITLLLRLVAATEAESAVNGLGVAPWYYEQLAAIYHKQRRPQDERAILERYARQPKAPGVMPEQLAAWLQALKESQPK